MSFSDQIHFPLLFYFMKGLLLIFIGWSLKTSERSIYTIPLWLFLFSESYLLVRLQILESWKPIFSIIGFLAELFVALIFIYEGFKSKKPEKDRLFLFAVALLIFLRFIFIGLFFQEMEAGMNYFLVSNMMLAFCCVAFIGIPNEKENFGIQSKICVILLVNSIIGFFNLIV